SPRLSTPVSMNAPPSSLSNMQLIRDTGNSIFTRSRFSVTSIKPFIPFTPLFPVRTYATGVHFHAAVLHTVLQGQISCRKVPVSSTFQNARTCLSAVLPLREFRLSVHPA